MASPLKALFAPRGEASNAPQHVSDEFIPERAGYRHGAFSEDFIPPFQGSCSSSPLSQGVALG
jgi:hypothetical protein